MSDRFLNDILRIVFDFFKILFIFVLVTVFVGNIAKVPSGSMEPTLLIGDTVLVLRCVYGYNHGSFLIGPVQLPFPVLKDRIFAFRKPRYGDLCAFRTNNPGDNKTYVKRLVGMPGDKIVVRNGYLYINDSRCPIQYLNETFITQEQVSEIDKNVHTVISRKYLQTLPSGFQHIFIKRYDFGAAHWDNCGPYYVPEKCYFGMGDNRDDSTDSRSQEYIGFIREENIVGKVVMVIMSASCSLWKLNKLPFCIRVDRFFKFV